MDADDAAWEDFVADHAYYDEAFLRARSEILNVAARVDAAARLLLVEYFGVPEARRRSFVEFVLVEINASHLARLVRDVLAAAGNKKRGADLMKQMRSLAGRRNRLAHDEVIDISVHTGVFKLLSPLKANEVTVDELQSWVADGQELVDALLSALELIQQE